MPSSTNLHDDILSAAGELFSKQGFSATTIKQIAGAAGCTTAALYYYFAEGKAQIRSEVIRTYQIDKDRFSKSLQGATSLEELILKINKTCFELIPRVSTRMNWLFMEYVDLSDPDKELLLAPLQEYTNIIRNEIVNLGLSESYATRLAWLFFCAFFGYEQLFMRMGLNQAYDFDSDEFGQLMARVFCNLND